MKCFKMIGPIAVEVPKDRALKIIENTHVYTEEMERLIIKEGGFTTLDGNLYVFEYGERSQ